jgi:NADH-quinone oxidoreductase subunit E
MSQASDHDADPAPAMAAASRLDDETVRAELREIIARYPEPRSALLPMLHLVQAYEGYVTQAGIELCAAELGLTEAEVAGVATFYTMYKRRPVGEYHVGVCTNTLCAIMGGDQIWSELTEDLGIGHDETTEDGRVSLERVECNAACDFAPVLMVNWEFVDNQTAESSRDLVNRLRAGEEVRSTRGPAICTWKQAARVLAGFPDGRATEGVPAGPASLAGLALAHEKGWQAPEGGAKALDPAREDDR